MIELFILLQLIQVLTPGSNLINFYEDQKEVGVRKSISHGDNVLKFRFPLGIMLNSFIYPNFSPQYRVAI